MGVAVLVLVKVGVIEGRVVRVNVAVGLGPGVDVLVSVGVGVSVGGMRGSSAAANT